MFCTHTGSLSPPIQFAEGNTVELVTTGPNRLINNLSLAAAYSPNGNGNAATVSVTNGWPPSSIAAMSFFENPSQYSAVMGQSATAGTPQTIELNNLRVANANQLGQYGE